MYYLQHVLLLGILYFSENFVREVSPLRGISGRRRIAKSFSEYSIHRAASRSTELAK